MQEEQHPDGATSTAAPEPSHTAATGHATALVYDSNPFTASITALKKLVRTNTGSTIGTTFFNILLFLLLTGTFIAVALSFFSYILRHGLGATASDYPPELSFLSSMSDGSIYATWLIGLAVFVFVLTLIPILQVRLTVSAARSETVKFGTLLKSGMRRFLPMLGYSLLVILAFVALGLVIVLLANLLGYITYVIGLVAFVAVIYVGIRLTYATYSIVDQNLGPIAAIKHSWKLSAGHVIETLGTVCAAALVMLIPNLIISALQRIVVGSAPLSGGFTLIDFFVAVLLIIVTAMPIAERYVQLQAVSENRLTATSLSPLNYLAIVIVVVLSPIINALAPKPTTDPFAPTTPSYQYNPYNSTDLQTPSSTDTLY